MIKIYLPTRHFSEPPMTPQIQFNSLRIHAVGEY